jgi:hypothetical protein
VERRAYRSLSYDGSTHDWPALLLLLLLLNCELQHCLCQSGRVRYERERGSRKQCDLQRSQDLQRAVMAGKEQERAQTLSHEGHTSRLTPNQTPRTWMDRKSITSVFTMCSCCTFNSSLRERSGTEVGEMTCRERIRARGEKFMVGSGERGRVGGYIQLSSAAARSCPCPHHLLGEIRGEPRALLQQVGHLTAELLCTGACA